MASFEEFVDEMTDEKYDLIVSNPPFYTSDCKSIENARNKARFQDSLPFEILLDGVNQLLSDSGFFAVIIPFTKEQNFISLAQKNGLYPQKVTRVKGNINTDIKRSLISFSRNIETPMIDLLIIEKERNIYTDEYIGLTKDFYLKM